MKLTGKCKEDFEKWYIPYIRNGRSDYFRFTDDQLIRKFYRKMQSEQYGVYVDFFDSISIHITVRPCSLLGNRAEKWLIVIENENGMSLAHCSKTEPVLKTDPHQSKRQTSCITKDRTNERRRIRKID